MLIHEAKTLRDFDEYTEGNCYRIKKNEQHDPSEFL
jgi:hypothetical protein